MESWSTLGSRTRRESARSHPDAAMGRIGSRPSRTARQPLRWVDLFGAVCPERAVGTALVMPYANSEAMNLHLREIAGAVAPGAHADTVLDGAGWHTSHTPTATQHHVGRLDSPELNPVENVWEISARTTWRCASTKPMTPSSTLAATPGSTSSRRPPQSHQRPGGDGQPCR